MPDSATNQKPKYNFIFGARRNIWKQQDIYRAAHDFCRGRKQWQSNCSFRRPQGRRSKAEQPIVGSSHRTTTAEKFVVVQCNSSGTTSFPSRSVEPAEKDRWSSKRRGRTAITTTQSCQTKTTRNKVSQRRIQWKDIYGTTRMQLQCSSSRFAGCSVIRVGIGVSMRHARGSML